MDIDASRVLMTLDGVEMVDGNRPFTLGRAIARALTEYPEQVPGDVKIELYKLAMKVVDAEHVEITPEDIVQIKKCVGLAYNPLIVGRVFEALGG